MSITHTEATRSCGNYAIKIYDGMVVGPFETTSAANCYRTVVRLDADELSEVINVCSEPEAITHAPEPSFLRLCA